MTERAPAQDVPPARGAAGFVGEVVAGDWVTRDAGVVGAEIEYLSAAGAPANGTDSVQEITVTATAGTWAVGFDGSWTPQLAHDISDAGLRSALLDLATIDGSGVAVDGTAPYEVTFTGRLGNLAVPQLETDVRLLVNGAGAGTATVVETAPGVTATGRNRAPGAHYTNLTTGDEYVNTGTGLAPSWTAIGTAIGGEITALAAAIPTDAVADVGALTAAAVTGTVEAGGVGAAAGGWDTAGHRDTTIATIGELKTKLNAAIVDLASERTTLNDLLAKLRDAGIITP